MKYKVLPIILEATKLAQGHAFVYHDIHTVASTCLVATGRPGNFKMLQEPSFSQADSYGLSLLFFLGHIDLIDVHERQFLGAV